MNGLVLLGLGEHLRPPAAKFRILIDFEISVEKSLRRVEPIEKLPVSLLQFSGGHLLGYNIAIRVIQSEATFLLQTRKEWSFGHSGKHPDHRQQNPVVLNEPEL